MRTHLVGTLLASIILLPLSARAQTSLSNQSEGDARIISDPLYLPLKGEVYGATAFTLSRPQGDNTKAGVSTGSFQSSNSALTQTIAVGVTDDFTVRIAAGYGSNQRDSTAASTGDVTTGNSNGFTDPTFSATYRVVNGLRSPVILDVGVSYSPSLIDATSSGGGEDGNLARGGPATGLSLALGHETRAFTIAATFSSTYLGRQTTELLSKGTSTASDAHWNYDVGLATQSRFTDRVSLNASVDYASTGSYGVASVQTGNPRTSEGPNTLALGLALNYHFVPNRVVGALTYTYDNYGISQNIFPNPASNTAVINRFGNVFGGRLMYRF